MHESGAQIMVTVDMGVMIMHMGQIANNYLAIKRGSAGDQIIQWAGGVNAIDSTGPQTLSISLPPSVVPPGVPITPTANPATVQLALYMQGSCRPETPALYAMDTVTTNGAVSGPDGGTEMCNAQTVTLASQCGVNPVPVVPTGTSTITFQSIFNARLADGGDPGSLSAVQRNIQATFDVLLADPRDECPGGLGPAPPCRGHITGSFQFYFERGKPAQAFP